MPDPDWWRPYLETRFPTCCCDHLPRLVWLEQLDVEFPLKPQFALAAGECVDTIVEVPCDAPQPLDILVFYKRKPSQERLLRKLGVPRKALPDCYCHFGVVAEGTQFLHSLWGAKTALDDFTVEPWARLLAACYRARKLVP